MATMTEKIVDHAADLEAEALALAKAQGDERTAALAAEGQTLRRHRGAVVVRMPRGAAPKPAIVPALPLREWSEVAVPEGANALEALTYVPGLVGDVTEWIVAGARRPNRMMALGVALTVVGTIIGRRIKGPTGSATHLYIINLAPTGIGKDHPMKAGAALMAATDNAALLGPQGWASAPGFENLLKRKPLMICFIDELGDELAKVNGHNNSVYVTQVIGLLKKCYNAWEIIITAEKVKEESETIDWPAPSIVGAATPEKFFEALNPSDLESGFANRLMILPFEGYRLPPEQEPEVDLWDLPPALVAGLRALPKQRAIAKEALLEGVVGPDGKPKPAKPDEVSRADDDAKATYFAFSRELDKLAEGDEQRYQLSKRACENAVRIATNIAVGRWSPTVNREDITHAIAVARRSHDAACGGIAQYMRQYYEFPKFCERALAWMSEQPDGFATDYEFNRKFRSNARASFDLQNVINQLLREKRIVRALRTPARGPAAEGYRVLRDGE
jgi:hypothetical protein